MAMDYGTQAERGSNHTKDTTLWIKNQGMVCILGIMAGFTKETLKMINETVSVSYTKMTIH